MEAFKAQFDIVLMDIEMRFMDGMTAAEEIRQRDPEVVIIFITNMSQYAIRGYAVDALDYVLKPVSYFAFSQRMNRAITRMRKNERQCIIVSGREGTFKLDIGRIMYVESQGHNLVYTMNNGQCYTASGTMTDAEQTLAPPQLLSRQQGLYNQPRLCRRHRGLLRCGQG